MSWTDRLKEAAYTSPGGIRSVFFYENVAEDFDKKTAAFNFPDAEGTYVQDNGVTSRRYPLNVIFWGDDYDLEATEFIELLSERGMGKLEHPIYGTIDVVPFGTISRKDALKTSGNQAQIKITFWQTIGLVYPTAQGDPASEVLTAIEEYNDAAAVELEEFTDLDSATERVSFKNKILNLVDRVTTAFDKIKRIKESVEKQFDAIEKSINNSIDLLVGAPLTLAFQVTQLIQAPARIFSNVKARLSAFRALAESIFSGDGAVVSKGFDSNNSNAFHANDLTASGCVSGQVVSVVNAEFLTKTEALEAAEEVIALFNEVAAWREANFASLEEIDTGQAYQQLQEAVALAAGFLVEISFTLKQERRFVLDRNRTVIDLVAELYGSVDDELDFFIQSNEFTGSEILEIEAGRDIVYYV